MPQITFEESKYDEIIRLVTKDGWYNGNKIPASARATTLPSGASGKIQARYSDDG